EAAEQSGAGGSGDGGDIAGNAVDDQGRQDADGGGLAHGGRDADHVGLAQRNAAQLLVEQVPEQAVADTAAAEQDAMDGTVGGKVAVQSGYDAAGHQVVGGA